MMERLSGLGATPKTNFHQLSDTTRHKIDFLNVSRRVFVEKLATFDGSHMARAELGEVPPKMSQV